MTAPKHCYVLSPTSLSVSSYTVFSAAFPESILSVSVNIDVDTSRTGQGIQNMSDTYIFHKAVTQGQPRILL